MATYSDGYEYHIHLSEGDIGRYVFLPGDPGRCETIAQHFDNPRFVASHREHTDLEVDGVPVAVTSTGMGGPSTAIAVEELIHVGADTFMRVGTSGAMQPETQPGDIAVVSAAIRDEGTGLHYLPVEFPAVADLDLINGLVAASKAMGRRRPRRGLAVEGLLLRPALAGLDARRPAPPRALGRLGQGWLPGLRDGVRDAVPRRRHAPRPDRRRDDGHGPPRLRAHDGGREGRVEGREPDPRRHRGHAPGDRR